MSEDVPQPKVLGEYKRELAMQYLLFGGLRYSAEFMIGMLQEHAMITLESLRPSSAYQFILNEGREEGRQALTEILSDLIGKRFADFNSKTELDCTGDFSALKSLYFDLDRFTNEDELRARLNELATTT